MLTRRLALALVVAAAFAGTAAGAPAARPDDMSLGDPKARIQVIEYASLSCPHCAHFNEAVFPSLQAKYIATGKVRYTLKEMLTPPAEIAAAGFLMARCAGPGRYFKVVDEVFRSQSRWEAGTIKPVLAAIGKANGLNEVAFEACLKDQAALDALTARVGRASEDGVDSTPTLAINGKILPSTPMTPAALDAAIAAASKAGGR